MDRYAIVVTEAGALVLRVRAGRVIETHPTRREAEKALAVLNAHEAANGRGSKCYAIREAEQ